MAQGVDDLQPASPRSAEAAPDAAPPSPSRRPESPDKRSTSKSPGRASGRSQSPAVLVTRRNLNSSTGNVSEVGVVCVCVCDYSVDGTVAAAAQPGAVERFGCSHFPHGPAGGQRRWLA